jgi:hypothetical protein
MKTTLGKLVGRCIQRVSQHEFDDFFTPYQFGVGMHSGCEKIFHFAEEVIKRHPDWLILKVDFSNAFNEVDRATMMSDLHTHFPQIYPWISATYGGEPPLWAKSSPTGPSDEIPSKQGTHQGDPLGCFLFSLPMHTNVLRPINEVIQQDSEGVAAAFLDDCFVFAPPSAILQSYSFLEKRCPTFGFKLNARKCSLYAPDGRRNLPDSFLPEIKRSGDAIALLGGIIGKQAEVQAFLGERIASTGADLAKLINMTNSQHAFLLFRLCACPKFNYLMRLMDPKYKMADNTFFAHHVDEQLKATFIGLLEKGDNTLILPHNTWHRARLPLHLGGMGILHAYNTHEPAFVASVLECRDTIVSLLGLALHSPIAIPIQSLQITQSARTAYTNLESRFASRDGSNSALGTLVLPTFQDLEESGQYKLQNKIGKVVAQLALTTLISLSDVQLSNVLQSCGREAAYAFTAIPKLKEFYIEPDIFRAMVCMRLDLPIPFIRAGACHCGKGNVNRDGYHLYSACKLSTEPAKQTHDAVRNLLAQMARSAGFNCTIESSETLRQVDDATHQRTDLTITNYDQGGLIFEGDVAITDPRRLSASTRSAPEQAAKDREAEKIKKYADKVSVTGAVFRPLVAELYGRWGPSLRAWFRHIVEHMARAHGRPAAMYSLYWSQRLAVTMQKTIMQGMIRQAGISVGQVADVTNGSLQELLSRIEEFPSLGLGRGHYAGELEEESDY